MNKFISIGVFFISIPIITTLTYIMFCYIKYFNKLLQEKYYHYRLKVLFEFLNDLD